jgi:hypothetical protein
MSYLDISPNRLKEMLGQGWEVQGFQPTISPTDDSPASTTDGFAILLRNGASMAILIQGGDGPDSYMRINFLTGESP